MSEFGVWEKVLILRETYLRRAMPTDEQHPPSRSLKPQMEKRRRARINDSLLQLKNLVLDALNKNNPRHSKLEKADILEMTVRYLRSIHRQQLSGIGSHNEQANIAQYQTGYAECMREVSRYLNATSNNNNAPNQAAILQNLMKRGAGERHLQASLLDHLVTRVTDHGYGNGAERMAIQEQKNVADTPNLGHSNNIPTLQFYTANKTPFMTSLQPPDAAAPRLHEEVGGGGLVNLVQSASVFSEGGSVATLESMACPSVDPTNPTGLMPGEEIRLVLPGNLVYSGQIPTHVIPIYAASSPTISPAQLQPSTVLSNIPSLSPSTPVVLTPVVPGDGHASNLLGSAVAPASGGYAFLHTPPSTCAHPSAPDSEMDSTDKPRQSSQLLLPQDAAHPTAETPGSDAARTPSSGSA
ncbi:transcription factor HES-1 [Strongylocentrotus purpuratus]|uniref:Uncharacterized protein n=1 Tax=Strongylocentrotus purpuratus TaxID=7668 RepID=A0A7M7SZQ6_STRPU|nr:transcription factor HES-1 [Strongylocentrotus purpuratus]